MTPDLNEETEKENAVIPPPSIGTELWGRPKPSTKVPGAKWIKIGFGEDPYHPQWHTGWKLVAAESPQNMVEPPPNFNENEFTMEPPPKIIRRSKKEVGNYNADLTAPKDD